MSWRDKLLRASFRGVPFFVDSAELQGGRRVLTHLFPFEDRHEHEDLGASPDSFRVSAYVLGDDYLDLRDALVGACRKAGAGILVLPRMATQRVRPIKFQFRESTAEAGICYLSLTFEREAGSSPQRSQSRASRRAAVESASTEVLAASKESFAAALAANGQIGVPAEAVAKEVSSLTGLLERLGVAGEVQAAAGFLRRVRRAADGVLNRIDDPGGLAGELQDLSRDLVDGTTSRLAAYDAYRGLLEFRAEERRGAGAQAVAAQENAQAVEVLARSSAVVGTAQAAADVDWTSRPDALAALGVVTGAIDDLSLVAPDLVFAHLRGLRTAISEALPGTEDELPRLDTVEVDETEPALVLAQRLYGSPDRADEIVARNAIAHPGFVPGGSQLEVVSSGA